MQRYSLRVTFVVVNLGGLNLRLQLGWEYYELMKGYDAMITAPEELGKCSIN
jgi:hypothetical protein